MWRMIENGLSIGIFFLGRRRANKERVRGVAHLHQRGELPRKGVAPGACAASARKSVGTLSTRFWWWLERAGLQAT